MTEQVSDVALAGTTVTPVETQIETMIPQSKVNELIGHAKLSERARHETALAEANAKLAAQSTAPAFDIDTIVTSKVTEQLTRIQQETINQAQTRESERVAQDFVNKLGAKEPDPELNALLAEVNWNDPVMGNIARKVTQYDNVPGIMKELLLHPHKQVILNDLILRQPKSAERMLKDMADSIRVNEDALKAPKSPTPTGREKPTYASADNGELTVTDLKKASWLKG